MAINAAGMLALNQAHVTETSPLDLPGMQALIDQAFFVATCGAGGAEAFLLAVDQDADYSSPNFLWFRARYPRFVYIDRVIVAASQRQRGWGRRFYADLFAHAGRAGHTMIACEVNAEPPNPASDAFHTALGFEAVGTATLGGGAKTVRYLVYNLAASAAAG
ncbi:GNAT family N-acetyltransferase [Novosphingobium sp. Chol11]|uniref:GNAT family N-acetyltransferase n=1 Tax=Novosphingobium sp. Chol11 TaxID=1385763 RepID=UPI0025E07E94|nr:GNAT family N-acetyltransferase [Novosphingobium sp. Chol11]